MSLMLYDDPLHESREASDDDLDRFAAAVYAAAVERREREASPVACDG